MELNRVPASLPPEVLDQLADLVISRLSRQYVESLPSKQVVAGSSPVSRSKKSSILLNSLNLVRA